VRKQQGRGKRLGGRWTGREKGSELVEAALIISLLLTFLIGIIWIARGFNVYQTMRRAAREGARFAVAPSCAMCGNSYPTDLQVQGVIATALQADNLDPSLATPISILRDQDLNPGGAVVETGVIINFNYPFQLYLPFTPVNLTNLTLNVQVQMREEK
jgi:Flp pilus assembly protein TadG